MTMMIMNIQTRDANILCPEVRQAMNWIMIFKCQDTPLWIMMRDELKKSLIVFMAWSTENIPCRHYSTSTHRSCCKRNSRPCYYSGRDSGLVLLTHSLEHRTCFLGR